MPLYERLDVYQKPPVRRAIRLKSCLIFFEQGVGKTHPTLAIVEELMDDKFSGFICVPLTNIETTWESLIKKELPQLNYSRDWDEFKKLPCPRLYLTHYEGLPAVDKKFTKFNWTFGGFDESQRIKAKGSRQSRIAGRVHQCEYRVALSGTPMDESPLDMYAQLRFAVPLLYNSPSKGAWKRFDKRFLKPTGYMGYKRKFRADRLPLFLKEVAPYMIRVEAKDVLDLPPVTEIMQGVSLVGEQDEMYATMERDMVVKIIGDAKAKSKRTGKPVRVSAGLKITQMIKLQQICGGFVIDDDGELHEIDSAKTRRLKSILKRKVIKPVVIFCKYTQEREQIEKLLDRLGWSYRSIHGKIKDKKKKKLRSDAIRLFQSGQIDAMVCQVRSGGVGVDLYKARTGIFYSTTFSYIDYDQARKRIDRRGQEHPTDLFFIYARNTIDEYIYSRILSKQSVSKSVFTQMKKRSLPHG